jgi:phosphinothricin acetyltransferase
MPERMLKPVDEAMVPEITEIYNYYVLNTTVTFHAKELDLEGMRNILFNEDPRFPSYAIYDGNELCGYCILACYKKREAYDSTAEVTVYLKNGLERRGIGTFALKKMEELAIQLGFHTLLAVICEENTGSIKLFTSLGYEKCAHYREVGIKFGRLLDVVCYQKILGPAG